MSPTPFSFAAGEVDPAFEAAVQHGLSAAPKAISPKWLYDPLGAKLFEAITELPEYYPTRTEVALLREVASTLTADIGPGAAVIELGAGSAMKTPLLLAALDRPAAYAPLDISAAYLEQSAQVMAKAFPGLSVRPLEADFTQPWRLPDDMAALPGRKVGFFPGSTIGNLSREGAVTLLTRAREALGPGAVMIVGVDVPKDPSLLVAAYDDALGVTAAFNKNLLMRINRELGGEFDLGAFAHEARWNPRLSRMEMHLRSRTRQQVPVLGMQVDFEAGETIHTESSTKYEPEAFLALAESAGWRGDGLFLAHDDAFSLHRLVC